MSLLKQLNQYLLPECSNMILDYRFYGKKQYMIVLNHLSSTIYPGAYGAACVMIGERYMCMNYRNVKRHVCVFSCSIIPRMCPLHIIHYNMDFTSSSVCATLPLSLTRY